MRRIAIALAMLAVPAAAGDDLARLFPADTFAYAEVDAAALEKGLPETQIMKILADPRLKTLLGPAFRQLSVDPAAPVDSILAKLRIGDLLAGSAAVGVRGISFVVREGAGKEIRFRIAPGTPVDARAVYHFVALSLRTPGAGGKVTIDNDVDFLAVGRPGALGRQLLNQSLDLLEGEVTRTAVKVGGHDATHVRVETPATFGVSYRFNFYVAERDGLSMVATHEDVLEGALAGGPRLSLATSPSLAAARARLTSGRPLLFFHVDLALAMGAAKGLLPPVAVEMGDINGLNALQGVGFGVSLTEGGLRESVGIFLDGNPRGLWKLLDAMPTGLRSLEVAPPGALAVAGVKFDVSVLRDRWRALIADVSPGNEDTIEEELTAEFQRETGLSLLEDFLPALGDEAALFLFPPRVGEMFPQAVVGFDARDEAAMAALVAKLQKQADAGDVRFVQAELPGGVAATRVAAMIPYDIHFAVHKGHLFAATNGTLLGEVFSKWGAAGAPCMGRDDETLRRVLAGAGAAPERLAMLGYVNLRAAGIETVKVLPALGEPPPAELFDPRGLSELLRIPNHLTGAAIALSHDGHGLVLDCLSPVGLVVPTVAVAVVEEVRRQQMRVRRVAAAAAPPRGAPSLGIATSTTDGAGVTVLSLVEGGPGETAGLQPRDRVVALDGVEIKWIEDLKREIGKREPGDVVKLTVRRGDGEVAVEVELGVAEDGGW